MMNGYDGFGMEKVIAFDFDGTVSSFASGWKGSGNIPDPPVPGIRELFQKLRNAGMTIVIFSCRAAKIEGYRAIVSWLTRWKLIEYVESVVYTKPVARCYVDDRAIRFDGKTEGLTEKIISFKAWWEKEEPNG